MRQIVCLLAAVTAYCALAEDFAAAQTTPGGQTLREWVQLLKSPDSKERCEAAKNLCFMKSKARAAVPALLAALKDPDEDVRRAACEGMNAKDLKLDKTAVPAFVAALKDSSPFVRSRVSFLLGEIGRDAASSVPALTEVLTAQDFDAAVPAAIALGDIGPDAVSAVPALIATFRELATRYANDPVLADWAAENRAEVARALGRLGPQAHAAIPILREARGDQNDSTRVEVALALWRIERNAGAIPDLVRELRQSKEYFNSRTRAAAALAELGAEAKTIVAELQAILKEPDGAPEGALDLLALLTTIKMQPRGHAPKAEAAFVLGRIGPDAKAAIPTLTAALQNPATAVQIQAAVALWQIENSKAGLPVVVAGLGSKNPDISLAALQALIDAGPPAVPLFLSILEGKNPQAINQIMLVLTQLGPKLSSQAAILVPVVLRKNAPDDWTIIAVAALGESAIWPLNDLLQNDTEVKYAACKTLAKFGPVAKAAAPNLIAALHDERAVVRRAATEALGEMGDDGRAAIPALIELLHDADSSVRQEAVASLGKIGPEARAAIPTLRQARQDLKDDLFQHVLSSALRRIDPATQ